jgi:hypothetical protein
MMEYPGSRVEAVGISNGLSDPSWVCLVDNINVTTFPPRSNFSANHFLLCDSNPLSDGQHTITLQATIRNNTMTFWFDDLLYLPSPSMSLYSSLIIVDASDPAIQYGPAWTIMKAIGMTTIQQGAKMTFDFNGVYFALQYRRAINLTVTSML